MLYSAMWFSWMHKEIKSINGRRRFTISRCCCTQWITSAIKQCSSAKQFTNVWAGTVASVDNGSVAVSVGDRTFSAPTPGVPLRVGDPVALVLRAEALSLSARMTAAPELCVAEGTVADVRFAGTVVSYRVQLGDRQLTVTRPPQAEILHEGAPVTVTWSPRDSILLPPEDERTP